MCAKEINLMRIKKEKPRCPKCDSANILVSRKKTPAIFWCRRCNFSGLKRIFFRESRKRQAQKVI